MTVSKPAHFVAIPLQAWGHLRPLLHTCIQLLAIHPSLRITILLSPSSSARCRGEIASSAFNHLRRESALNTPTNSESGAAANLAVLDRLQLLDVAKPRAMELGSATSLVEEEMTALLPTYLAALFGAQDKDLNGQDNRFVQLKPNVVIYDMFNSYVVDMVEATTQALNMPMIPLLSFWPCPTAAIVNHFHPDPQVGAVSYMTELFERPENKGKTPAEIFGQVGFGDRGIKRKLHGLPEMTDFEYHPGCGLCPVPPFLYLALMASRKSFLDKRTVGALCVFTEEIAQDAEQGKEVFGMNFHPIGMQYPDNIWDGEPERPAASDTDGVATMEFLDRMHKQHGDNSVIYVSFGSAFFPILRPQIVESIITTLLEADYPFVFAHASELIPIPQYLLDMVKGHENAHHVRMAPQIPVLHHPATGMFLSHCGGNSTSEAITAGVGMVGMPFVADQGEYCALMKKWGAMIDLKQVKTFAGDASKFPKVTYDGVEIIGTDEAIKQELADLWVKLKGGYADELRSNMQKVREICYKSRQEGRSRQEMEALAKYF